MNNIVENNKMSGLSSDDIKTIYPKQDDEISRIFAMDAHDHRTIIEPSVEIKQEILNIIQLGLSGYSYDENLPRPLKVTIDISDINVFTQLTGRDLPKNYSDTIILTLNGKDYLEDILNYIRQYIQQDSDAEVELHSRFGSITKEGYKTTVYDELIKNILTIFYEQIIYYIIHKHIYTTHYLEQFVHACKWNKIFNHKIIVTSANHRDNSVFMKIDWWTTTGDLIPSHLAGNTLKAILYKDADSNELREKILSIDNDVLEYIAETFDAHSQEYL